MKTAPRFKNMLLATAAFVMLGTTAANASESNDICIRPEQRGKMGLTSRVISRDVLPSDGEQRGYADEVFYVKPVQEYTSLNADETNHFTSGWHMLSEAEKSAFAQQVASIGDKIPEAAEIIGFADVQPLSPEAQKRYPDNHALSVARAQAVADYLKTLPGWADANIRVRGVGELAPKTSCVKKGATPADITAYQGCLAADRRTEVRIWYKTEKPLPPPPACKDAKASDAGLPFRISVDGEPEQEADVPNSADVQRCNDIALEKSDVQVRFDGLQVEPVLNVTAAPEGAAPGEATTFTPYANYNAFFTRAEIRIFPVGVTTQGEPAQVLPLENFGSVSWTAPRTTGVQAFLYILRVYDAKGRFDETDAKVLELVDVRRPAQPEDTKQREDLIGYGENHRHLKNIPVKGGSVTVNGENLLPNSKVQVLGMIAPVDANGKFALRQILPAGDHRVNVATDSGATRNEFNRDIYIPRNDWFYVGIADLTVGQNSVKGPAAVVTGDDSNRYSEDLFVDGRLAYYLKGKVRDSWLLTSSADTQEAPVDELFSNFTAKDPRALLRRLDPNAYYPVYGDDSTLVEDAPTSGKFYVKLEKDDSHIMWGNFQTKLTGTDLMNYQRSLYGGRVQHNSTDTTSFGEKRTEIEAFVADPGTLDAIEEFRGTGGSLYYLQHQDLTIGSERLRIEVRDRDSGIVLSTAPLVYGQDYDVNYLQGRVILRDALPSTSDATTLVRTGSLSGNPVFLVADYEFAPGVTEIDNMTKGGRASHWVNDHVKLGVTGYDQKGTGVDQSLLGGDVTLRYKPGTYIKMETAKSDGTGTGAQTSQNGGFDFAPIPQTTVAGVDAQAHRVEAALDLAEVTGNKAAGHMSGYWLHRDDGFSAPGQLTNEGLDQSGAQITVPLGKKIDVTAKADIKEGDLSGTSTIAEGNVEYRLTPEVTAAAGVRHDDRDTGIAGGASAILSQSGQRTDGVVKLGYAPQDSEGEKGRYDVYGIAQMTIDKDSTRSGNDRFGAGGNVRVNDRLTLGGEVTGGDGGLGGRAGLEYKESDRTSHYINYLADNGRSDTGLRGRTSNIVAGTRNRYSDTMSVYSEQRYQFSKEEQSGLIHAFGMDLAPNDRWNWGAKFENGTTSDPASGDLERTAVSLSTGYHQDKVKYGGTLEWRKEDGNVTGERNSWLTKNTLTYQTNADWRALAGFNMAIGEAGTGSTTDADFTELTLGLGYRPVLNDRLNALVKYTYLSDRSSAGQLSATGGANPYEQRSHVFSGDAIYDLTRMLSLGGKLGYRFGELRDNSVPGSPWFDSTAWLGIARFDFHIVHEWDLTAEARYLDADDAGDAKAGALLGVYKHINENVKFGLGYNFTDFDDDLTNQDYTSQGYFINLVGAM
ncbi:MAG: OmpA family protein [bacterium]|nr:OmpA family protein [bacterium]